MQHQILTFPDRPYAQRRALQAFDEVSYDLLRGLVLEYHRQIQDMRIAGEVVPLRTYPDLDTTRAAKVLHLALAAAFAGKRKLAKQLLVDTVAELAEVRYAEESVNPGGFYELLYKSGEGVIEDERAYDAQTALNWFNKTDLGPREDAFVDKLDKEVYPRLELLYTYLDTDDTLTSIGIGVRHARQKHPRPLQAIPKGAQEYIAEQEAQEARAERYRARSGESKYNN